MLSARLRLRRMRTKHRSATTTKHRTTAAAVPPPITIAVVACWLSPSGSAVSGSCGPGSDGDKGGEEDVPPPPAAGGCEESASGRNGGSGGDEGDGGGAGGSGSSGGGGDGGRGGLGGGGDGSASTGNDGGGGGLGGTLGGHSGGDAPLMYPSHTGFAPLSRCPPDAESCVAAPIAKMSSVGRASGSMGGTLLGPSTSGSISGLVKLSTVAALLLTTVDVS